MARFLAQHPDLWQADRDEDIDPLKVSALKISALEAPNFKHQITNKFQWSKFQTEEIRFGHSKLKFGIYLEFGLPARSRFGEGRDLDIEILMPVWFRLCHVRRIPPSRKESRRNLRMSPGNPSFTRNSRLMKC